LSNYEIPAGEFVFQTYIYMDCYHELVSIQLMESFCVE